MAVWGNLNFPSGESFYPIELISSSFEELFSPCAVAALICPSRLLSDFRLGKRKWRRRRGCSRAGIRDRVSSLRENDPLISLAQKGKNNNDVRVIRGYVICLVAF